MDEDEKQGKNENLANQFHNDKRLARKIKDAKNKARPGWLWVEIS